MSPVFFRRLAMVLLGLALPLSGCKRPPGPGPELVAADFFATVARGDVRSAYGRAAFSFQAAQTPEAFEANCQDLGLIGAQPPVWTRTSIDDKRAVLSGDITNQAGKVIHISANLLKNDNSWEFYALHSASPDADHQTENRFTLVGKGPGFKDVYHQPMPGKAELLALAQETMANFADAIQRRDFEPFYHYVAQGWRDGTVFSARDIRRPGAATDTDTALVADSRLSIPLLQSNFGAFIEKKVDLTPMSKTLPVFTRPPHIDINGALNLDGYFTDNHLRANFSFQYVYELPKWRLGAMNIEVRE